MTVKKPMKLCGNICNKKIRCDKIMCDECRIWVEGCMKRLSILFPQEHIKQRKVYETSKE
jgi:hypothetical protein